MSEGTYHDGVFVPKPRMSHVSDLPLEEFYPRCDCGNQLRYIKGGIARVSGKPYDAFWGCTDFPRCKRSYTELQVQQQIRSQAPRTS